MMQNSSNDAPAQFQAFWWEAGTVKINENYLFVVFYAAVCYFLFFCSFFLLPWLAAVLLLLFNIEE